MLLAALQVAQIAANPAAEAAWYLPRTREQFRVRGNLRLVTADAAEAGLGHLLDARRARWAQISDAARSGFASAPPGEPLVESEGTDLFCFYISADISNVGLWVNLL